MLTLPSIDSDAISQMEHSNNFPLPYSDLQSYTDTHYKHTDYIFMTETATLSDYNL